MSQSDVSALPPPPRRFSSGYPPNHKRTDSRNDPSDRIDWANLSGEDKEEFFLWLDEFFSRFLNVKLGPRNSNMLPLSVPDHHQPSRTGPPVSVVVSSYVPSKEGLCFIASECHNTSASFLRERKCLCKAYTVP